MRIRSTEEAMAVQDDAAKQAKEGFQSFEKKARAMGDSAADTMNTMAEQGREAADRASSFADRATTKAREAADAARELGQRLSDQAAPLARDLYDRGKVVGEQVTERVEAQPFLAIMVAALFGYI